MTVNPNIKGSKLCPGCEALYLDDSKGHIRDKDSISILKFENEDGYRRRETHSNVEDCEIVIDYQIVDHLPELPGLEASAEKYGCQFCQMLRSAIVKEKFDYCGEVVIKFWYLWEGDFGFSGTGLSALVADLVGWTPDSDGRPCHFIFTAESNDGK